MPRLAAAPSPKECEAHDDGCTTRTPASNPMLGWGRELVHYARIRLTRDRDR